jgi:nitrate/TMAO reductase-like tetraheme cytochrome c subunit
MLKKPLFLALVCSMIILPGPQAEAAKAKWDDCVGCHVEREEAVKAPYVGAAVLETSVHKGLKCIDCHSDIREVKHVVGEAPHQRYAEEVSCTKRCHVKGNGAGAPDFSPMEQYRDSVHGVAREADMQDAATCTDCHGRHGIRPKDDPESTVYRLNIPRTCAVCHEDMQVVVKHHIHAEMPFQEYERSVHGKALYRDGLIEVAAVCIDCHGVHDIQAAGMPNLRPRRPETCGTCHIGIYQVYRQSTHGRAAIEDQNPDAPVCTDCHGEHTISVPADGKIPEICSQCHAEEGLMSKYEIPVDRTATYEQSYHGVASGYGSMTVANCASCHGHHDILPPTDPKSSVYPANLVTTCGKPKCHPGISAKVASAKMHVDVRNKESGGVYYVRKFFVWAFIGLLIITFIWVVPDLARRVRRKGVK